MILRVEVRSRWRELGKEGRVGRREEGRERESGRRGGVGLSLLLGGRFVIRWEAYEEEGIELFLTSSVSDCSIEDGRSVGLWFICDAAELI